ncbi:radical SAM protein [bacterium]|nr:radical SAM protein [bacterium]NIN92321.1 radical SAM protein [bacterium]NIO18443.1 radical SAM protein [bacterium]NIO73436.1 radical SAM protein [bacterium]
MNKIMGKIKNLAIERMASQAIKLMGNSSDENLVRFASLLEKVAGKIDFAPRKGQVEYAKKLFKTRHPFTQWMKRIGRELNPRCRDQFTRIVLVKEHFTNQDRKDSFKEKHGFFPPTHLAISPITRCNLRCDGCWAGKYAQVPDMEMDLLEKIMFEARDEMGIHFYTITGGEPFLRKDLLDFCEKFSDCYFNIYTNGTLVTDKAIERIAKLGNVAPMFSLEGGRETTDARRGKGIYDKVIITMKKLRDKGAFFGFSITETRYNAEEVSSEAFIDEMLELGCFNGWYFQYIPIGLDPNPSLMLTPWQRDMIRRRIYKIRNTRPIFVVDFWNDGPAADGCMAAGKKYLHINCKGDIEPCVFVHFACDNIKEKSLTEALKSPFFRAIRASIPYEGNTLRACMIVDRPELLREYCRKFNAYPTHEGGETLIGVLSGAVDNYAHGVAKIFNRAWEEGDWMKLFRLGEPKEEGQEEAEVDVETWQGLSMQK